MTKQFQSPGSSAPPPAGSTAATAAAAVPDAEAAAARQPGANTSHHLENQTPDQEKAMKSHLLEYLDQHRRLEESVAPKKNEKSDVKSRLQVIVLFPHIYFSSLGVCAAEEAERKPFQPEPGGDGGGSGG